MTRWLMLLALTAACRVPDPECTSTVECGGGRACLDGECREVECLSGADCDIEHQCHPDTYTCEPGCATSDDCLVGDRCDVTTNTCVGRTCQETQADCELGERCDLATNTCKRDPAPYCDPCRRDSDCGQDGVCAQVTYRDGAYCLLPCSPEAFDPCPAGMQCSASVGTDGEPDYRCVGLCGGL